MKYMSKAIKAEIKKEMEREKAEEEKLVEEF